MTENVNRKDNCPDELICPITLQLFVDPVRAKDGHVYEREAITRWIFEHGTSPLTREPLTINDLISDKRLKSLSRQRRNSTVSFNSQNSTVIVPSFRNILINNRQIVPQTNDQNRSNNQIRFYSNRLIFFIILFSFIFPVSFIIGIVLGLQNSYSQDIEIRSTYSDSLAANNSYNRSGYSNDYYYYKKYQINIITSGFYGFEIDSQTDIRINGDFYIYYFNSNQSNENLLTYSYKDQIYKKTYLGNQFQSQVYILVITTYLCCKEGSFSILVTGPNTITFQ